MFKNISVKVGPDLTRVNCFKSLFQKQADFVFWVPTSSLDEHGFVPANIIRARIKHSLKVNQGHFSYTTE